MAVVAFVGMDAFREKLRRLHSEISGRVMREATYAGASVFRAAIAAAAPGGIGSHIIIHERRVRKYSQKADDLALLVGPERKRAFHALWVEAGFAFTSGKNIKKRSRGGAPLLRVRLDGGRWVTIPKETFGKKIAGRPFVRPAFDASQREALAAAERVIAGAIEKEGV